MNSVLGMKNIRQFCSKHTNENAGHDPSNVGSRYKD